MGHPDYRRCRDCGRSSADVGPLSWTRLCGDCAELRYMSNLDQMVEQKGDYYDHWARRSFMAARRRLPEHLQKG